LKFLAKKVVFLVLSGKKQIAPLLDPLEKILKSPLVPPPGKSLSDARGRGLGNGGEAPCGQGCGTGARTILNSRGQKVLDGGAGA